MAKIARARALDSLPVVACPAAVPVAGVVPARSGVVCGVIARDRQRETGIGVSAGAYAVQREGGDGDVFLTIETDPQSVEHLCCGAELPVLDEREVPGNRASYTYCPVWQAEKWRIANARDQLGRPPEPEPAVAHWDDGRGGTRVAPRGSSYDSADPWAQARRDVARVAPDAGAMEDDYGPIVREAGYA